MQEAIAEHKSGNYARAEILYKRVLDSHPNHVEAAHYLALIAQEVNRHDVAVRLLEKVASLASDNANIFYNLALSYQQLGQLEFAKSRYLKAIQIDPAMALAYNNLGIIYQQEGMHEKANALFRKAISIDPEFANAYYNLSNSEKFKVKPGFLDNIENLLKNNKLPENDAITCHFALGKIYDDLSLYPMAFEHYRSGNQLKNTLFNINAYSRYVDSIIQVFDTPRLKKTSSSLASIGELIFIIGMPRSGTTLVEQIISSHSKVTGGGELGLIGEIIDNIDSHINVDLPYPHCFETIEQHDLAKLADLALIELEKIQPGYLVLTDKTPINFLHVGLIHLLFPNAKVIHCQRDPVDNCLSCYFQNFNRQHHYSNDMKSLGEFYRLQEKLMNHWKSLLPEQIFTIQYETLVKHQEEQTRNLIQFCELEWEDNCMSFNKNQRTVTTASNWQVKQGMYSTSIQRWKNYEPYIHELLVSLGVD